MDAFWFVDFSFLSLFSQEAVKAAVCMLCVQVPVCGHAYVCVCFNNSIEFLRSYVLADFFFFSNMFYRSIGLAI